MKYASLLWHHFLSKEDAAALAYVPVPFPLPAVVGLSKDDLMSWYSKSDMSVIVMSWSASCRIQPDLPRRPVLVSLQAAPCGVLGFQPMRESPEMLNPADYREALIAS